MLLSGESVSLGQWLIERGLLTAHQRDTALAEHRKSKTPFGQVLLDLHFVRDASFLLPLLAQYFNVPWVCLRTQRIPAPVLAKVPAQFACFYKVMPVACLRDELTLAVTDPTDTDMLDSLAGLVEEKITVVLADEKNILEAIQLQYGIGADTLGQMTPAGNVPGEKEATVDNIKEAAPEASIRTFINQIIFEAYKARATDIHIEPSDRDLRIRYRIDGVLCDARLPSSVIHYKNSINARIKIMSNLNIAEKRLPQDGRCRVMVGETHLDLRVSFLPTQTGESAVIRILPAKGLLDMEALGLAPDDLETLQGLVARPHGIIFVTGPTGCGKTTTLYACLHHMNKGGKKIITIEDPVEYQLKNITQVQVHPEIQLTFARGLRSMLRHDPDIMLVGEVRDEETARVAIQIALTGHLVFSTLHTNDAASGVTRLSDMGIEPYLISSAVECFIAQRLVRRICPHCRVPFRPSDVIRRQLEAASGLSCPETLFKGQGCEYCHFTGYFGREGIYEFLVMNEALRECVLSRSSSAQIRRQGVRHGMRTLWSRAWEKVFAGRTTTDEVFRVAQESSLSVEKGEAQKESGAEYDVLL